MIKIKPVTPEVYFPGEPIVTVGAPEIGFLEEKFPLSPRRRVRLCAHQDTQRALHEMFVVYSKQTYSRPNVHPKYESLHVIRGSADFVYFDKTGKVIDVVELGDYATGRRFYTRIPPGIFHTFIILSDTIVIHETIAGPFRKETDTIFADWAPTEEDAEGIRRYTEGLDLAVAEFRRARQERVSP